MEVHHCDINLVETSGASLATARCYKLPPGIPTSHQLAQNDFVVMNQYKSMIVQSARDMNVDPAIIAGIISRESRAGTALDSNGWGDHGNGFGIMQVDKRHHAIQGGPYSLEHIKQGIGILIDAINGVAANHPDWSQENKLKGGIAAYNFGVKNVWTIENMDVGTTGNDYSNDVVARSQWYKANGY